MDALAFFLAQHGRLHFADVGEERPLAERIFGGLTDGQLRHRPAGASTPWPGSSGTRPAPRTWR
jgi:hypothetical protein